jgi:hypothetical protein
MDSWGEGRGFKFKLKCRFKWGTRTTGARERGDGMDSCIDEGAAVGQT